MSIPSMYRPTTEAQFIGPARRFAAALSSLARAAGRDPIAVLLWGAPGIGKTALATHFARSFPGDSNVVTYNGTQLGIDEVEQIGRDLRFRDMFGRRRIWQIEEVDQVTAKAQIRLLTILDNLPQDTAFVCTTNVSPDQLQERFQTRFTPFEITPPTGEEIEALLGQFKLPTAAAKAIAHMCGGNVRQALLDANAAFTANLMAA
jgi:replication-associated recombination protein RarA